MSPLAFLARPERWLWAIHRYRDTLSAAPNFAFELCLRRLAEAPAAGLDLSSLRLLACGAEPVTPDTLTRFAARLATSGLRPAALAPVNSKNYVTRIIHEGVKNYLQFSKKYDYDSAHSDDPNDHYWEMKKDLLCTDFGFKDWDELCRSLTILSDYSFSTKHFIE